MKRQLLITIAIALSIISCQPENKNVIALDVLLIPSKEMTEQAIHLNRLIVQNNPASYALDENHIPHITLLQCFVREGDLPKIEEALTGLFQTISNEPLKAKDLFFYKEKDESFVSISIKKSPALLRNHAEAIKRLKQFILKEGSADAFVPNPDGTPIDSFTLNYVPKFIEAHSFENFNPHISLGMAQTDFLNMLAEKVFSPAEFHASALALYQIGNSGTAQKRLWTSQD